MAQELVTMSAKEVDRLEVIRRVLERRLKRVKAAQVLGITTRQVRRLCDAYESEGAAGLVSRRRGRPSNNRIFGGSSPTLPSTSTLTSILERWWKTNDWGRCLRRFSWPRLSEMWSDWRRRR